MDFIERIRKRQEAAEHEATGEIPPERGFCAWLRRFVGGQRS